ncbi:uncharacterized protein LOC111631561 [Centruroides sculpturatus]|uniref:uncharacterized protein LOC111631561 n=1 Tax=Centruroides sculpturatus TaxID=218467 RepID=UPI000C6F011D|nr:uncharacterized protein LOC111631561 [Centruroides sculpturatus]
MESFLDRKDQTDISSYREKLILLKYSAVKNGLSPELMCKVIKESMDEQRGKKKENKLQRHLLVIICVCCILLGVILQSDLFKSRCAVPNNYLVMEITRPLTDCKICRDVDRVIVFENVTKATFAKYAYSGKPMLVRGATTNWTALNYFNFSFFKQLYENVDDAYQSVEEECQFFPYKTDFLSLEAVFDMPEEQAYMTGPNAKTWYIGWSNCNPEVASILRQHYSRPFFLPDDSESSAIDWIFMGYSGQGASMHLDYVQRPSWQAQISGTKSWHLLPPPECEAECKAIEITVRKGDIILIDTNQWYHETFIHPGEISITIGSEYD